MRRWMVMGALLLAAGTALPAWADDATDCFDSAYRKADPGRAQAACNGLFEAAAEYSCPVASSDATAQFYRKTADEGDAESQFALGCMYAFGAGVPKDEAEMVKWWRKAADQGHFKAQYHLAAYYALKRDEVQEYMWDVVVALNVAMDTFEEDMAESAVSTVRDLNIRMNPAKIRQADALVAAWRKRTGHNVAEAEKRYRQAADQGNPTVQAILGLLYYQGLGVAQDYVQAFMWLSLAAAQGDTNAAGYRDNKVAFKMTRAQIEEAQALAAAWKPTQKP